MAGRGASERILAVVLGADLPAARAGCSPAAASAACCWPPGGVALVAELVGGATPTCTARRASSPSRCRPRSAALVLLALAVMLPGRRYAPPWSRAADILETLLVLSVIPLALGVMGVYGALRNLPT